MNNFTIVKNENARNLLRSILLVSSIDIMEDLLDKGIIDKHYKYKHDAPSFVIKNNICSFYVVKEKDTDVILNIAKLRFLWAMENPFTCHFFVLDNHYSLHCLDLWDNLVNDFMKVSKNINKSSPSDDDRKLIKTWSDEVFKWRQN